MMKTWLAQQCLRAAKGLARKDAKVLAAIAVVEGVPHKPVIVASTTEKPKVA